MKTPRYDEKQIELLHNTLGEVRHEVQRETDRLIFDLSPKLEVENAKEYVIHGVGRRFFMMMRCIDNVYAIFPPERAELLEREERLDLEISLHAFISNLLGAFDNLAWAYVYERSLESELRPSRIGLFNKATQKHFPSAFREYLDSDTLSRWRTEYAKNYRDALAHKIPLYVAPSYLAPTDEAEYRKLERHIAEACKAGDLEEAAKLQDRQDKVGSICECFVHSFSDSTSKPVKFHAQVLVDVRTLVEVCGHFRSCFVPVT